jgi:hypothetical protein
MQEDIDVFSKTRRQNRKREKNLRLVTPSVALPYLQLLTVSIPDEKRFCKCPTVVRIKIQGTYAGLRAKTIHVWSHVPTPQ